ncbi:class I SAM-dependent methyltransferase [Nocardia sp. GCM10030253]|uniref:class I SAM-dependent methyltransferase n=1 Tax=Nocardia sp. GCM10030253 TaxID=3273404 RepID=UPI0036352C6C
MIRPADFWNSVYDSGSAPWVIGEPQPAIVDLVAQGWVRGAVLDVGCGAGEHTIHLAGLGYDVLGVDLSPSAIAYARASAEEHGVSARFEVADALDLGPDPLYDTIIDSALFHVFAHDNGDPTDYVRSLRRVCKPGGLVHVLALSDVEPGFGPRIGRASISEAFGAGWVLEELQPARYRGRVTEAVAEAEQLGLTPGSVVDEAAWLARVRRSVS